MDDNKTLTKPDNQSQSQQDDTSIPKVGNDSKTPQPRKVNKPSNSSTPENEADVTHLHEDD